MDNNNETKANLQKLGVQVLDQLKELKNPDIELPVRTLSNIFFDEKKRLIQLGTKVSHRTYMNIAHTRKFMQTLMVAAECKKLLSEKVSTTTSIRDLYYILKRTIPGTQENTFEEQEESVWPDEPILVRIGGELKLLPGSEILAFAEKTGRKIYDTAGRKRITNVDLKVCAFGKNQKITEHDVSMVMKHPSKTSVNIKTSSGREVKVTPSHSLFTIENGKPKPAEVKKLKVGDWIALPKKIAVNANPEPINVVHRFLSLAPQDVLKKVYLRGDRETINSIIRTVPKKMIKQYANAARNAVWSDMVANWKHWGTVPLDFIKECKINVAPHLSTLTLSGRGGTHRFKCLIPKDEYLGYVLGLLLSEGSHCTIVRKLAERHISISNKSQELLNLFALSFKKAFGSHVSSVELLKNKDGTYKINAGSNMLGYVLEYVFDYGAKRAWDKSVPSVVLDAPESCLTSFLTAFFLGDGSFDERKQKIRFHTTSRSLVNGIVFLMLRQGVFANIYEYEKELPSHRVFELKVESREFSKILADHFRAAGLSVSGKEGFADLPITEKTRTLSGDRIPHLGMLLHTLRKSCPHLDEKTYKNINFSGIEQQETISRPLLGEVLDVVSHFSPNEALLDSANEALHSDIYWDKIIAIDDCGKPPYTIDLSVKPAQNFIGGNGMVILHNSDPIIEDIEASLNALRENLHLHAEQKGSLVGPIVIREPKFGTETDCAKMGASGYGIPSICEPETVQFVKCDAKFVLVVEKDAVWQRLNEDRFWRDHNCLILTGKGQPDRGTRRMINRLHYELNLPVYVVTDADPWGYYIYSVIKQGSINLSFVSDRLGTPEAKYIGLTTKDVDTFGIKKNVTIKLNEGDKKRAQELMSYVWFKPKEWQSEIKNMVDVGYKLELEALSSKGIKFITEEYLPKKIKDRDFLP